ncbi:MAG: glycosyltransferase family 39 protein [Magnetococcus sp. DMHC-8]
MSEAPIPTRYADSFCAERDHALAMGRQPTSHAEQWGLEYLLLFALMAFHVFLYWWAGPVLESSDDLAYITYARQLLAGDFVFQEHHFAHRPGLFAPVALLFWLFDAHLHTATLLSLLASLATIWAVHRSARRYFGPRAGLLAALLLAANSFQLQQSLYLGPDILLAWSCFVGMTTLLDARRDGTVLSPAWSGWLISTVFFFSLLVKVTVVWILVYVFVLFCLDLVAGRQRALWGWIVVTGLGYVSLYLGMYAFLYGDPLYHLHVVEKTLNNPTGYWVFTPDSGNSLFARLTYQPLLLILNTPGYVTLLLLILPLARHFLRTGDPDRRQPFFYWSGLVASGLFLFWFATSSFKFYNPIGLYERHFLFIAPPLSVLGGAILAALLERPTAWRRDIRWLLVAAATLFLALHWLGYWKREVLLLGGVMLVLFTNHWWERWRWSVPVAMGVVVVTLLSMPVLAVWKGSIGADPWHEMYRELIRVVLPGFQKPILLYTDSRSQATLELLLRSHPLPGPPPVLMNSRHPQSLPSLQDGSAWLLLLSSRDEKPAALERLIANPPATCRLVWQKKASSRKSMHLLECLSLP